jgi:hypothetical protein
MWDLDGGNVSQSVSKFGNWNWRFRCQYNDGEVWNEIRFFSWGKGIEWMWDSFEQWSNGRSLFFIFSSQLFRPYQLEKYYTYYYKNVLYFVGRTRGGGVVDRFHVELHHDDGKESRGGWWFRIFARSCRSQFWVWVRVSWNCLRPRGQWSFLVCYMHCQSCWFRVCFDFSHVADFYWLYHIIEKKNSKQFNFEKWFPYKLEITVNS